MASRHGHVRPAVPELVRSTGWTRSSARRRRGRQPVIRSSSARSRSASISVGPSPITVTGAGPTSRSPRSRCEFRRLSRQARPLRPDGPARLPGTRVGRRRYGGRRDCGFGLQTLRGRIDRTAESLTLRPLRRRCPGFPAWRLPSDTPTHSRACAPRFCSAVAAVWIWVTPAEPNGPQRASWTCWGDPSRAPSRTGRPRPRASAQSRRSAARSRRPSARLTRCGGGTCPEAMCPSENPDALPCTSRRTRIGRAGAVPGRRHHDRRRLPRP